MSKIELENEDLKWLEERMKQESEDIEVPESLEPENILEQLKAQKPKKPSNWKRTACVAASLLVVAGVSLQAGRMVGTGSNSSDSITLDSTDGEMEGSVQEESIEDDVDDESRDVTSSADVEDSVLEDSTSSSKNSNADSTFTYTNATESFQEGDGKAYAVDGDIIYSGEGKEIVISQFSAGKVKELSRISINQNAQEFYQVDGTLVCVSSDENSGTTVYTFDLADSKSPQMNSTISVGGAWQCSYLEGTELYVFTDTGSLQRIDLSNNQTNTFAVEETDVKYYMAGDAVYTFQDTDDGTVVQKYNLSDGSFQKAESVVCTADVDRITAVDGDGATLKLLVASEDGLTLQMYDDEMRLTNSKKNSLGEEVFISSFTEDGILVFSYEDTDVSLTMLDQDTLETKSVETIHDAASARTGELLIAEENSWYGFTAEDVATEDVSYYVYSYDEDNGFQVVKSAVISQAEDISNDFAMDDSVLIAAADGIEVLLE